jgi:hypothetical protein
MPLIQRLDQERMLAGEDSRQPEMTEPSKFPVWLSNQDGGAEEHSVSAGWLDLDLNAGTDTDVAFHNADKRIPLGVCGKIRQHSPHLFPGGINLDLAMNLLNGLTSSVTEP